MREGWMLVCLRIEIVDVGKVTRIDDRSEASLVDVSASPPGSLFIILYVKQFQGQSILQLFQFILSIYLLNDRSDCVCLSIYL